MTSTIVICITFVLIVIILALLIHSMHETSAFINAAEESCKHKWVLLQESLATLKREKDVKNIEETYKVFLYKCEHCGELKKIKMY